MHWGSVSVVVIISCTISKGFLLLPSTPHCTPEPPSHLLLLAQLYPTLRFRANCHRHHLLLHRSSNHVPRPQDPTSAGAQSAATRDVGYFAIKKWKNWKSEINDNRPTDDFNSDHMFTAAGRTDGRACWLVVQAVKRNESTKKAIIIWSPFGPILSSVAHCD